MLRLDGHDAMSVVEQNLGGASDTSIADAIQREARTLITLDTDFADIRAYPPQDYSGLIVLRLKQHDKSSVLRIMTRLTGMFEKEPLDHRLWIVEAEKVRIRS